MTNIELHSLEAIAANLPRIAAALERLAKLNEGHLEVCREMLEMDRAEARALSPDVDFTAPSGGVPEAQESRRQKDKLTPANS